MDVRMPDGTIVTNVPDNVTQEEVMRRYNASTEAEEPSVWEGVKRNLKTGLASAGRGVASVAKGVISPLVDVTAAAMRLPWTLTGNEAPAGLRNPALGGQAVEQAKQSMAQWADYEPGALARILETGMEFVGGGEATMALALKYANQIRAAAAAGNSKATILNAFTEMAAKHPNLYKAVERATAATQGVSVGTGRELFQDENLSPFWRTTRDIAFGVAGGAPATVAVQTNRFARRNATPQAIAAKKLMVDQVGDPTLNPNYEANLALQARTGTVLDTAELTENPIIANLKKGRLNIETPEGGVAIARENARQAANAETMRTYTAGGTNFNANINDAVRGVRERLSSVIENRRQAVGRAQEGWASSADVIMTDQQRLVDEALAGLGSTMSKEDASATMRALLSGEDKRLTDMAQELYQRYGNPDVDVTTLANELRAIRARINPMEAPENVPGYLGQAQTNLRPKEEEVGIRPFEDLTEEQMGLDPRLQATKIVRPFEDLTTMRRVIGNEISMEKAAGNREKVRYLTKMMGAVEDALAKGGENSAALAEANAFFKQYANEYGFRQGTTEKILAQGKGAGTFAIPTEKVGEQVWQGGTNGQVAVRDYLRAFSAQGAPRSEAVAALEQTAMADLLGMADPKDLTASLLSRWKLKHKEALAELPELAAKVDNLLSARKSMERFAKLSPDTPPSGPLAGTVAQQYPDAAAAATALKRAETRMGMVKEGPTDQVVDTLTRSRNRKVTNLFLGADPEQLAQQTFGKPREVRRAVALAKMDDSGQAMEGLRRAYWEETIRRFETEAKPGQNWGLKPEMVRTALRKPEVRRMMSMLYKPEQLKVLEDAVQWERMKGLSTRPINVTGSDTSANLTGVAYIMARGVGMGYWGSRVIEQIPKAVQKVMGSVEANDIYKIMDEALANPDAYKALFEKMKLANQQRVVAEFKRAAVRAGVFAGTSEAGR